MVSETLQLKTIPPEVLNYINELETSYNQKIKELEASLKDTRLEYLVLKENYDLLVYKRFVRSAEQLLADKKQRPLFTEEEVKSEAAKTVNEKQEELVEIKPFTRKKNPGR